MKGSVVGPWLSRNSQVFQKASDLVLSYVAVKWNDKELSLGTYFLTKAANERSLLQAVVPILEQCKKQGISFSDVIISKAPELWKRPFEDDPFNQIKIYAFVVNDSMKKLRDSTSKQTLYFVDHVCDICKHFLRDRFSATLKKEVLLLVGLIYNLKTQRDFVHLVMRDSLLALQQQYFPAKSRDLQKYSTEDQNFQVIMEGFLNMLLISQNLRVRQNSYVIGASPTIQGNS